MCYRLLSVLQMKSSAPVISEAHEFIIKLQEIFLYHRFLWDTSDLNTSLRFYFHHIHHINEVKRYV